METKEKIVAGVMPVIFAASAFVSWWLPLITAFVLVIISGKLNFEFAKKQVIKSIDLFLSIFVLSVVIGLLGASLSAVARDSGSPIPYISDGILVKILILVTYLWLAISIVLVSIFGFVGKDKKIPCPVRPVEFFYYRNKKSNA